MDLLHISPKRKKKNFTKVCILCYLGEIVSVNLNVVRRNADLIAVAKRVVGESVMRDETEITSETDADRGWKKVTVPK